MKLLVVTQKVDKNDAVLGFMHGWLLLFAKYFKQVEVICLELGDVELPDNVKVSSLGKEMGNSKTKYILNFYRLAFLKRGHYDAVFVHMNPEYVILGGLFWRFCRKKIIMWYNHTYGDLKTKLAMILANILCHTSPYAFTANTKKSIRMPAGIDMETFMPKAVKKLKNSILYLGRISPVKDLKTLIEAVFILEKKGFSFVLDVYGDALFKDRDYLERLKQKADSLVKIGRVNFYAAVANFKTPEIFSSHEVSVNLTPAGNYDKTVLETIACGSLPLVSSPAFADLLSAELFFKEKDPNSLALALEKVLILTENRKKSLSADLREDVLAKHSLSQLVLAIKKLYE